MNEIKELVTPMVIEKNYSSFEEFYKNEKRSIYIKIIDVFEDIIKENIKERKLLVVANIDGCVFDTNFLVSKIDKTLLTGTVSSYFEQLEEYETCNRIAKLCSELQKV